MENKKRNIIFIIFAVIMGILMLLVDVFLSINNFKLMLIAGVGILVSIFIISLVMFVISFSSFKEKGFLFNNAYIFLEKRKSK